MSGESCFFRRAALQMQQTAAAVGGCGGKRGALLPRRCALVRAGGQHPSASAHGDALHGERQRPGGAVRVAIRVALDVAPRVAGWEAQAEQRPRVAAAEGSSRLPRVAQGLRAAERGLQNSREQ